MNSHNTIKNARPTREYPPVVIEEKLNNGEVRKHTFTHENFEALKCAVLNKEVEYITKYNSIPFYVKMPKWMFKGYESYTAYSGYSSFGKIADLYVCPTDSIDTIEEIEVF